MDENSFNIVSTLESDVQTFLSQGLAETNNQINTIQTQNNNVLKSPQSDDEDFDDLMNNIGLQIQRQGGR